jgi:hypothetical protein
MADRIDIDLARRAGYLCGLNGPDTKNCNARHFATREMTLAWEEGKRRGEEEKNLRWQKK